MWGAIAAGAGMGLGLLTRRSDDKRQIKQQQKLTDMQKVANSELMGLSYEHQKNMYDHTYNKNTPLQQVKNLKEAGLNPALMYGLGGQGGATAGGGGASVGGGSAANAAQTSGAMTNQMGMGLQMGMMEAQKKLIESQANNLDADTEKKKGVDTEVVQSQIQKLIAETENTEGKTALQKVETLLKKIEVQDASYSQRDRMDIISYNAEQAAQEVNRAVRENKIGEETATSAINQIKAQAIGAEIDNEVKRLQKIAIGADIQLTNKKTVEIGESIRQKWTSLLQSDEQNMISWDKLNNDTKRVAIEEFKVTTESEYKGLNQVGGKLLDRFIGDIWNGMIDIDKATGTDWGNTNKWRK